MLQSDATRAHKPKSKGRLDAKLRRERMRFDASMANITKPALCGLLEWIQRGLATKTKNGSGVTFQTPEAQKATSGLGF